NWKERKKPEDDDERKYSPTAVQEPKQSFFNCLLDMAALDKGGSRQNSISFEANGEGAANSQTHLLASTHHHHHANGDAEHNSLATLARRSTIRKRSVRNKKVNKFDKLQA
ncbi:Hypothetical predicted protein, partial [Drosophila guanche]